MGLQKRNLSTCLRKSRNEDREKADPNVDKSLLTVQDLLSTKCDCCRGSVSGYGS